MSNSNFWNSRARKFGHTGWANYSIYAFDQAARLKAIQGVLEKLQVEKELALDFGTGTGGFARLLSEYFKEVIAFDTSDEVIAIAKTHSEDQVNIDYSTGASVIDTDIANTSLDLVLSITVLGHLMEEELLHSHLQFFKEKLANMGTVIALEYTPARKIERGEYQNFLTFTDWKTAFEANGFVLEDCYGFYSPSEAPCNSYIRYKSIVVVKFFTLFQFFGWAKKGLEIVANKIVNEASDYYWPHKDDDLVKIMVYKKA